MATQGQSANATLRPSQAAYAALLFYEHQRMTYYNDSHNGNCTYGVGTLVHRGPCTPEELRRTVTREQVTASLDARVNEAAGAVRRAVSNRQLTQAQFDALVTYTYNRGATGAHPVLHAANQGNDVAVVSIMNRNIHQHQRDPGSRHVRSIVMPGLVQRRLQESAPFRPQR